MEKGSLHLYLVAKTDILESEEITVAHDTKNPLPCPYEGCPHMKNKDSGTRTGLAASATTAPPPPPPVLSPVETDRKRRRRRTNSMATNDASSNLNTTNSSASGPSGESPATTPVTTTSVQQAAQVSSVPSTPPLALPPTPVKRQSRTPSKVSAVVTEGEDSQDDSLLPDEGDGPGSLDNESSSNKKKLVNISLKIIFSNLKLYVIK